MATDRHRRTAFHQDQPDFNTERTAEIPHLHPLALSKAYPWQTKTFAAHNHIEEQTARKRYSQTGSYFGVVPQKLANGRLTWPNVIVTKHGPIAANQDTMKGLGNAQRQRAPQPMAIRARSCFEEEQGE